MATTEQVSCALHEEACILNLKNSVYYGLDPVGARVWELLRAPHTVSDILNTLLLEYDVDSEVCQRDLFELLENLHGEGLIELRAAGAA